MAPCSTTSPRNIPCQNATYTLGNGTGAYQGVTGSGKATLNILGIAARNSAGKCSMTKAPAASTS